MARNQVNRERTQLRVDPWDPEYGASIELENRAPPSVVLDVETDRWEIGVPTAPECLPRCAFVDGVRQIDLRLSAEQPELVVPALAGSWAVGSAWAMEPPKIDHVEVGRVLVVGGGIRLPDLVIQIGRDSLKYPCRSIPGRSPIDPIQALVNQMRQAEANLASRIFNSGEAELLILDGPLTYFSVAGPVVGLIKRQSRAYLPPEQSGILGKLPSGTRTPLFGIGDQQLTRYSWYVRIASGRPIDGVMTGLVRLELSMESKIDEAIRLADLTASILPRFASRIGRDPRAPQNLYPIGRLESVLRHRLGDRLLLRRALEAAVWWEGTRKT